MNKLKDRIFKYLDDSLTINGSTISVPLSSQLDDIELIFGTTEITVVDWAKSKGVPPDFILEKKEPHKKWTSTVTFKDYKKVSTEAYDKNELIYQKNFYDNQEPETFIKDPITKTLTKL